LPLRPAFSTRSFATILAGIDSDGDRLLLHVQSRSGQPQRGQMRPTPVAKTVFALDDGDLGWGIRDLRVTRTTLNQERRETPHAVSERHRDPRMPNPKSRVPNGLLDRDFEECRRPTAAKSTAAVAR